MQHTPVIEEDDVAVLGLDLNELVLGGDRGSQLFERFGAIRVDAEDVRDSVRFDRGPGDLGPPGTPGLLVRASAPSELR